jgi:chemotaxis protein methyltransferase CheR
LAADVTDADCISFLQWALPRLGLRWRGFRKVRRQVCRRVAARLDELELESVAAYRAFLESHPDEWRELDARCHVTISRFYRDRGVFAFLGEVVLPALARAAAARGETALRAWSAGCASGEEPFTLALVWELELGRRLPGFDLQILATDVDETMLARSRTACYPESSLRELPARWRELGFVARDGLLCLRDDVRTRVTIGWHDVRTPAPDGPFDLVLCRNVAFTYFDERTQRRVCELLAAALVPGGALVLGRHEALPPEASGFDAWSEPHRVYRRRNRISSSS